MMTKQAELKNQAYESTLKSRALSVLIYLIDRSNQELTCFPAIPTMAQQLHISVSTVKRALHELVDCGYIRKDSRFREKNRGQTSNLYTLVLLEHRQPVNVDAGINPEDHAETNDSEEGLQRREDRTGAGKCEIEHIYFETLEKQENDTEQYEVDVADNIINQEKKQSQKIRRKSKEYVSCSPGQKCFSEIMRYEKEAALDVFGNRWRKVRFYLWTGPEVNLGLP